MKERKTSQQTASAGRGQMLKKTSNEAARPSQESASSMRADADHQRKVGMSQ